MLDWAPQFDLASFENGAMSGHARLDAASQLVEALVYINRLWLHTHRRQTPELLTSGVRFQAEPDPLTGPGNWFADIPSTIARGYGHCVALTAWRIAELREKGEHATVSLYEWPPMADGNTPLHVFLKRGNGKEEDIAKILGMP